MISFFGRTGALKAFQAAALAVGLALTLGATPAMAASKSSIVVDAKTGKTLHSRSADSKRYPASLTKMMTLYMLFEAIESGKTGLNSRIRFSARAAGQAPSKLGLKKGQTIRVKDAILALVTKSANDVATAVAEHVAGTESQFATRMTKRARALGMSNTTFRNASGLPNKAQVTTARDMALLGRALRDHYPQYFHYFKTPSFTYKGRRYGNHNRLLGRVSGVDGIKTGYTRASGFNLVTSVKKNGRYIVAVVIGGSTGKARDATMTGLVKKFLPKATRGKRTVAMVPGGSKAHGVVPIVAVADYPPPRLRTTAVLATGEPIRVASVSGANSPFALDALPQGDAQPDDESEAGLPQVAPSSGWKIQLAATPSQASAEDVLNRALTRAGSLLADATPYTETVTKSGTTLYRARFGGFATKAQARAACTQIKRKKFDCIALQ
ncbi:MAG: D-alanyl-D-alanine carboxypeptidase [Alphaproteobacteria bacterium]